VKVLFVLMFLAACSPGRESAALYRGVDGRDGSC